MFELGPVYRAPDIQPRRISNIALCNYVTTDPIEQSDYKPTVYHNSHNGSFPTVQILPTNLMHRFHAPQNSQSNLRDEWRVTKLSSDNSAGHYSLPLWFMDPWEPCDTYILKYRFWPDVPAAAAPPPAVHSLPPISHVAGCASIPWGNLKLATRTHYPSLISVVT